MASLPSLQVLSNGIWDSLGLWVWHFGYLKVTISTKPISNYRLFVSCAHVYVSCRCRAAGALLIIHSVHRPASSSSGGRGQRSETDPDSAHTGLPGHRCSVNQWDPDSLARGKLQLLPGGWWPGLQHINPEQLWRVTECVWVWVTQPYFDDRAHLLTLLTTAVRLTAK